MTLAMVAPFAAPAAAPAAKHAFRPSADASVNLGRPSARFGARSWLRIAAAPRWRVYLRFHVRGLHGPVRSAQLVLQGRRRTWTPRLQVRAVGRPWRERRVTARRAARLRHLGVAASTRRDGRRTRRVVVDVTSAVAREGIVTLVVSTPNRRGLSFYSREVRRRAPRLVVTTRDEATAQADGAGSASGAGSATGAPPGGGAGAGGTASSRATGGLWISRAEIAARPASGAAWNAMRSAADGGGGAAALANQDSDHDVTTLAAALVAAKTGSVAHRDKAKAGIASAIGTESGARSLAVGRNLPGYVIAADVINLAAADPGLDARLRSWLQGLRTANLDGDTLVSTHERRPNNWGTMSGAARIAASLYLGDGADVQRAATVFRGYLGDRDAYAGFEYGELSFQADPGNPVGVGAPGAVRDGQSVDGALPDDMRRGCALAPTPCPTGYPWEGLQGAVVQAELLWRAGYDAWGWQSQALLRAARYLLSLDARHGGWWAEGDDTWQPWLLNHAYGTSLPATSPSSPGKIMGFTDWTHAG